MDFELNEEQQMLREGAERFLQDNYSFEQRTPSLDDRIGCRDQLWHEFADLGWLAIAVPEARGGLGAGLFESALLAEAMGRRAVVEPFAATAILGGRLLESHQDQQVADSLLAEIVAGSLRFSLACLEPGGSYELRNPSTKARRVGAGYVLSGSKQLCLDAPAASKLLVSADLDGGLALFMVDAQASGLRQRRYPTIDGRQAADIDFVDVQLTTQDLLACGEGTHEVIEEAIDRLRVFEVAEALGSMERVMELTAEHLRNRKQFGQPLGAFQALQHRMAEMFVEVQETRSALYHALSRFDDGAESRKTAVSSAKVVAIEAGRIVGGLGIQLHGGVGMTTEYEVGHHYKRLLVIERAWGDLDFHLDRIAVRYS